VPATNGTIQAGVTYAICDSNQYLRRY